MVDRYISMILSVLAFLWVAVHYNMYNSACRLPTTRAYRYTIAELIDDGVAEAG